MNNVVFGNHLNYLVYVWVCSKELMAHLLHHFLMEHIIFPSTSLKLASKSRVAILMGLRKNTSLKEKLLGNDPCQAEKVEQSNFANSQIPGSCLQQPQQNVRTSIFQ